MNAVSSRSHSGGWVDREEGEMCGLSQLDGGQFAGPLMGNAGAPSAKPGWDSFDGGQFAGLAVASRCYRHIIHLLPRTALQCSCCTSPGGTRPAAPCCRAASTSSTWRAGGCGWVGGWVLWGGRVAGWMDSMQLGGTRVGVSCSMPWPSPCLPCPPPVLTMPCPLLLSRAAASAWRAARPRGSAPRRLATSTRACPAWGTSSRWVGACLLGAWWASGGWVGEG